MSTSDKAKVKTETKKLLRSILISAGGNGLGIGKVLHDFKEAIGKNLPHRAMGYTSAEDFFRDSPDVVYIQYNRFGEMMLRGISDENTYHIESMIRNQKRSKPGGFVKSNVPRRSKRAHHFQEPPRPVVDAMTRGKIKSLLYAYPHGLHSSNFSAAYSRRFGHELDLKGFRTVGDMLRSLPDMIDIEDLRAGGFHLYAKTGQQRNNLVYPNQNSRPLRPPASELNDESSYVTVSENTPRSDSPPPLSTSPNSTHDMSPPPSQSTSSFSKCFDDDSPIPAETVQVIQEILEKNPDGVWAANFPREYRRATGKELPVKKLGYKSVIEFMDCLTDIVIIERPNESGWILYDARTYQPTPLSPFSASDSQGATKIPCVYPHIKETIRQVVAYHKEGVKLADIAETYLSLTGENIPVEEMGFTSTDALIASLSDTLDMTYRKGSGSIAGELIVTAIDTKIPPKNMLCQIEKSGKCKIRRESDGVPLDAVGPGEGFRTQDLPSNFSLRENENYVEIFVSNIETPGHFWLQLKGRHTSDALEDLMDLLEETYYDPESVAYTLPESMIQVGQACAALYAQDDNWHRAYITGVKNLDYVECYYVDYGNTSTVVKKGLKLLKSKFMRLPAQAIEARLTGIEPFDGKDWTRASERRLLTLVQNIALVALVTDIDNEGVLSVCLCDTGKSTETKNNDLHINDELVNEKHARLKPLEQILNQDEPEEAPEECRSSVPEICNAAPTIVERHVKRVTLSDVYIIHVIRFNEQPYSTSGEIAAMFWKDDHLRSMLRRKKLNVPREVIAKSDYNDLFEELASYKVKGLIEGSIRPHLTIYNLHCLSQLLEVFNHPNKGPLIDAVRLLVQNFNPNDLYWKGGDNQPTVVPENVMPVKPTTVKQNHVYEASSEETVEELKAQLHVVHSRRKEILQGMMHVEDAISSMLSVESLNEVEGEMRAIKKKIQAAENKATEQDDILPPGLSSTELSKQKVAHIHPQLSPPRPLSETDVLKTDLKTNIVSPMRSTESTLSQLSYENISDTAGQSINVSQASVIPTTNTAAIDFKQIAEMQESLVENQKMLKTLLMSQTAMMQNPQLMGVPGNVWNRQQPTGYPPSFPQPPPALPNVNRPYYPPQTVSNMVPLQQPRMQQFVPPPMSFNIPPSPSYLPVNPLGTMSQMNNAMSNMSLLQPNTVVNQSPRPGFPR